MWSKRSGLIVSVLVFSLVVTLWPQSLGEGTYGRASAPPIPSSKPMMRARGFDSLVDSPVFVSQIGGVAFGRTAQPEKSLTVDRIAFGYDSSQVDGSRFVLRINDIPVHLDAFDWQLMPTAMFANSGEVSIVTAFGKLHDKTEAARIKSLGGYVFNYHPAFDNTLLGLRLLQADLLVMAPDFSDLPRKEGEFILGEGETAPLPEQIEARSRARSIALDAISQARFRSYVVTDAGVSVTFRVENCRLEFQGEPYYRFWRYRRDRGDFDRSELRAKIESDIQEELRAALDGKAWLVTEIVRVAQWLVDNKLAEVSQHSKSVLEAQTIGWLQSWLADLKTVALPSEVEAIDLSETPFADPLFARNLNPAVYDAAQTTMRLSAFFRYLAEKNPEDWKEFISVISTLEIGPAVETPTTFVPSP